ncbi:MAG: hypothetical protein ACRCS6_12975, partial [Turicibacter sp.]
MQTPLAAGSTGILQVNAKFTDGITPALINNQPNAATCYCEATGSNISYTRSNTVTLYPTNIAPNWSTTKYKNSPIATPTIDSIIEYGIDITGNSNQLGALNLTNITLVDSLPIGAQFISASSGGIYLNNTVTWTFPSIAIGTKKTVTVKIQFPPNTVTLSSTVTNNTTTTCTPIGLSPQSKGASYSHGFAPINIAIGNLSKTTRTSNDKYSVGQSVDYLISGIQNTGNTVLNSFLLMDSIPTYLNLTSLSTGSFKNGNYTVNVYYQTNLNSVYRLWTGSSLTNPNDVSLLVSSLNLVATEYITKISYELTTPDIGFDPTFAQVKQIHVIGTVRTPPTIPYTIANTATVIATKTNYPPVQKSATRNITVINPMPWIMTTKKTTNNIANYNPNALVEYSFTIQNNAWATGSFLDPIAIDVIPLELNQIEWVSSTISTAPSVTQSPVVDLNYTVTINNIVYQAIKVLVTGNLSPGEYVTIVYRGTIKSNTLNGYFTNDVFVGTQNAALPYQNSNITLDTYDLNKNGL